MIWENYEAYCADMERFNAEPMSEPEWIRSYGSDAKQEEPLIITPRNQRRAIKPTMDNHALSECDEKKPDRSEPTKPEKYAALRMPRKTAAEKEATKAAHRERENERRREAAMRRRIEKGLTPKRTNLSAMSEEERAEHKRKIKKAQTQRYMERLKNDPEKAKERKERNRIHSRAYRQKKPEVARKYALDNPEVVKEAQKRWRDNNREKLSIKAKERRERIKAQDPMFLERERKQAKERREKSKDKR